MINQYCIGGLSAFRRKIRYSHLVLDEDRESICEHIKLEPVLFGEFTVALVVKLPQEILKAYILDCVVDSTV